MAATHSARGNTVDHAQVARINETMTLVSKLERLGWTHAQIARRLNETKTSDSILEKDVYDWARGKSAASTVQCKIMQNLVKLAPRPGRAKKVAEAAEYDHSPKSPEESAKHDAERSAIMLKKHGTTTPVKPEKKKVPDKKPAPSVNKQRVITLLTKENPKRAGSAAHKRFALYKSGMTVEQFLAAGGTSADVTYDVKHSYISVA